MSNILYKENNLNQLLLTNENTFISWFWQLLLKEIFVRHFGTLPLAAAAVAKQQAFSREQAALVESQIHQQHLGELQQQQQWQQQSEQTLQVKNETPAWLQEIIKKETVQ